MKVTIIYGTDNGNTRDIATQIASEFDGKLIEISSANSSDFEDCDLLILGTSTCGYGDLQPDWDSRLSVLKEASLSGKKVALFGLGDQITYADTFVDAMGLLYDEVAEQGASVVGATPTTGYDFFSSLAVRDEKFVGLALDVDNQSSETDERITSWVAQLKAQEVLYQLES